ncbi:MAG: ribosome biogenesis GTPase Der [Clostridiales bacterium]|nr:ribosome biogenesis GTPase Der [Clostridiales bacterium]
MKPCVAIVGRPNVGKSTLFNKILGKRVSIVGDVPGVTRDRIYGITQWNGLDFEIIDTGGIEEKVELNNNIISEVKRQSEIAIEIADVVLLIVDINDGIILADVEIARKIQKNKKQIILVCNKVDNFQSISNKIYEFYSLGISDLFPVSSIHGLGVGDLLDKVVQLLPVYDLNEEKEKNDPLKVAIVGKPNVGKSSLINKLLGEKRVIVNKIAGTTRDSIDSYFENECGKYILIDTAGMRKKGHINENIEKFGVVRTLDSIDRSDVCILMLDVQNGITEQDTKIIGYIHEKGKASLLVINKRDLIEKYSKTIEKLKKEIKIYLKFMDYIEIVSISAKNGQNIKKIFNKVNFAFKQTSLRIQTGALNETLNKIQTYHQPPTNKGKRLKIYYITQTSVKPPTFILFINDSELAHFSYLRYIENKIRDTFGFIGTPIRLLLREKSEKFIDK